MADDVEKKERVLDGDDQSDSIILAKQRNPENDVKMKTLEQICMDIANRMNGFPFISCSRLMSYDDTADEKDTKKMSTMAKRLRMAYIMTGNGSLEKFKELYVGAGIVYIQAHKECPTLSDDGCYNSVNIIGKPFKTVNVAEYVLKNLDQFKPFVIVKQGPGKFGMINGDPYHHVTAAEVAAVKKMFNPEAGATGEEPKNQNKE